VPLTFATILSLAIAVIAVLIASLRGRKSEGASVDTSGRLPALEQALATEQAARQQVQATLRAREAELQTAVQEIRNLSMRASGAEANVANQAATIKDLRNELSAAKTEHQGLVVEQQRLTSALAAARMELSKEQEKASEKLTVLLEAKKELSDQFSTLANKILEEKSARFAEQNKASLDQMLLPLKTQLTDFKGTVERAYEQEGKDRSALAEQVRQLHMLNTQLSADATGLTNALKGSSQRQGSWGEMVLERILESSGLRKGQEYRVQESVTAPDGTRDRPDVIINLPEGKHLVIDSKNSLLDYNDHVNGETEAEREQAAARHIVSIRTHINGLSKKDYRSLHSLNTVDFVIMFIPIEPAFMLAIGRDPNLFTHAWDKNVLLVSPSTLLFVIRTVSLLWKQELQRSQWQEIALQGGRLYDKFSDFVGDLTKLGDQLRLTQKSYEAAFNKLKDGKGNLLVSAEKLHRLGLKVKKPLPAILLEAAAESAGEESSGDKSSPEEDQPGFALAAEVFSESDTSSLLLDLSGSGTEMQSSAEDLAGAPVPQR
jgi:DNA recombination protein RmuC